MAANDYTRTISITPLSATYAWGTPPSWITITRIDTSNDWKITIATNTGSYRTAILSVTHSNGVTTDTMNVIQEGVIAMPTSTPVPPTATPTPTPTSIPGYLAIRADEAMTRYIGPYDPLYTVGSSVFVNDGTGLCWYLSDIALNVNYEYIITGSCIAGPTATPVPPTETPLPLLTFPLYSSVEGNLSTGRSYTWNLSGFPQTGHKIHMGIYGKDQVYTITGTSGYDLSYGVIGAAYAAFLNGLTSVNWIGGTSYTYTQGNPVGFEPTASYDAVNNRLTFNMNWTNQISAPYTTTS